MPGGISAAPAPTMLAHIRGRTTRARCLRLSMVWQTGSGLLWFIGVDLLVFILWRRRRFLPDSGDLLRGNGVTGVAPTAPDIGQHVGDVFVVQVVHRDHDAVVSRAVDHNLSGSPQQDATDIIVLCEG